MTNSVVVIYNAKDIRLINKYITREKQKCCRLSFIYWDIYQYTVGYIELINMYLEVW